jgi:hypothetical protein
MKRAVGQAEEARGEPHEDGWGGWSCRKLRPTRDIAEKHICTAVMKDEEH